MGMGARGMQEGDVVCILFGSRVPFILRRTGDDSDCWHLIGDAYVYGMMDVRWLIPEHRFQQLTRQNLGRRNPRSQGRRYFGIKEAMVPHLLTSSTTRQLDRRLMVPDYHDHSAALYEQ